LVAFQGCCAGFDGESTLPITGGVANDGGEDIDVSGGGNIAPKLGWAGAVGIMGAIGGEMGAGDMVGSAIL